MTARPKFPPGARVEGRVVGTGEVVVGEVWSLAPGGYWVIPEGSRSAVECSRLRVVVAGAR